MPAAEYLSFEAVSAPEGGAVQGASRGERLGGWKSVGEGLNLGAALRKLGPKVGHAHPVKLCKRVARSVPHTHRTTVCFRNAPVKVAARVACGQCS
jgi:hypothetical protein